MLAAAEFCANLIQQAPVWIIPCLEGGTPTRTSGSSIYPAVQNMLLAARALGLGATLTTPYLQFEKEAEAALDLPPGVHSYALLPISYPMGRFGPVRRVALSDGVSEGRVVAALQGSVATANRGCAVLINAFRSREEFTRRVLVNPDLISRISLLRSRCKSSRGDGLFTGIVTI